MAFSFAVLAPTLAFGKEIRSERWTIGTRQGFVEYTVRKGRDNVFSITCDENAFDAGAATKYGRLIIVDVVIRGQAPPENGSVLVSIDGTKFKFSTDESRTIETFDRVAQAEITPDFGDGLTDQAAG
jgi:hypothetical protein